MKISKERLDEAQIERIYFTWVINTYIELRKLHEMYFKKMQKFARRKRLRSSIG